MSAPTSRPLWSKKSAGYQSPSVAAKLFLAVLLIVVLEGAFRKWISASLTIPLVLLRDVLALGAVACAVQFKHLRFSKPSGAMLLTWSALVIAWALLQAFLNDIPIEIVAIGLRFWLLYLWFAVAVAVSITEADFRLIVRSILVLMVMMVPLVVVQYLQPPTTFINKQVSNSDDDLIFIVANNVVRTTGTFSFTLGFTTFLGLVTPYALANLTAKVAGPKDRYWKALGIAAMVTGTLVSGSRTAFLSFFVVIAGYFVAIFFVARVRLRLRTYVYMFAGGVLLGLLMLVFSSALDNIEERAAGARETEDIALRITDSLIGTSELYENFDVIGNGIGFGANFAGVVLTGERAFLLGESEIERVVLSGGLLGLIFVLTKILVASWGVYRSIGVARGGNVLPLLLWLTSTIVLLLWPMTGQLTVNAMGFIVLGCAFAATRFPHVGAMR